MIADSTEAVELMVEILRDFHPFQPKLLLLIKNPFIDQDATSISVALLLDLDTLDDKDDVSSRTSRH
ncbi:hypothetical protein EXIGLDRAFT_775806 [Exidia glandulosa HHB12029]|uniref:Uncharacterized protein n=1 Tax=Exidia glandulosa HHB12029 TaxID=1314781 RepID=A0A165DR38_EXIGL|nr:hypothetical protein EXIGLDRAFT_775806 [Exidia glandulosa HHB12029]